MRWAVCRRLFSTLSTRSTTSTLLSRPPCATMSSAGCSEAGAQAALSEPRTEPLPLPLPLHDPQLNQALLVLPVPSTSSASYETHRAKWTRLLDGCWPPAAQEAPAGDAHGQGRQDGQNRQLGQGVQEGGVRMVTLAEARACGGARDARDGPDAQGAEQLTYAECGSFSLGAYFAALRSRALGRTLLYAQRVTSTQELVLQRLAAVQEPVVVAAGVQVSGHGRGQNAWESPEGCLCFTFKCQTHVASRLPFFQYLVSLALVDAVEAWDANDAGGASVRLKWPNDVYCGASGLKIGGVLCQSSFMRGVFDVVVGVGINVDNEHPTTCLNAMLAAGGTDKTPITREWLLATFLSTFERHLGVFELEGFAPFEERYLQHWLHTDQQITLQPQDLTENEQRTAVVRGLTEDGFLKAQDVESGQLYELHPDGNSLDFFKGLVVSKRL